MLVEALQLMKEIPKTGAIHSLDLQGKKFSFHVINHQSCFSTKSQFKSDFGRAGWF